jgi:hypothetical protein
LGMCLRGVQALHVDEERKFHAASLPVMSLFSLRLVHCPQNKS